MVELIVKTTAYNAEKTLHRAVDSVLNQTYPNFTYYLCDNGSTDGTRAIVDEYAQMDNRIIPFYNLKNHVWKDDSLEYRYIDSCLDNNALLCVLDADDEYHPTFFEDALNFMQENDLDIVVCGSEMIDAAKRKVCGTRSLNSPFVLSGDDFNTHFPIYYKYFRTKWGKIFKGSVLKGIASIYDSPDFPKTYGGDTYYCFYSLAHANRIGILPGEHHKYYISNESVSYRLDSKRIDSDRILHKTAKEYLLAKIGHISKENEDFLYHVYFNAIKDTLNVVINADILPLEKLKAMRDVFTHETTRELNNPEFTGAEKYRAFIDSVAKWILAQDVCRQSDGAKAASEILASMYESLLQLIKQDSLEYLILKMPEVIGYLLQKDYKRILERFRSWHKRHEADEPALSELEIFACRALNKPDHEMFELLASIMKKRPRSSQALDVNTQIQKLIGKYPLLKNASADLASAFPYAICWILKGNFAQALAAFLSASQHTEITDKDEEAYLVLGQNLSAAADNTGAYIYFKKLWISYLIDCSQVEEAGKELDEFEQLLPGDEDFIELRKRLLITSDGAL